MVILKNDREVNFFNRMLLSMQNIGPLLRASCKYNFLGINAFSIKRTCFPGLLYI